MEITAYPKNPKQVNITEALVEKVLAKTPDTTAKVAVPSLPQAQIALLTETLQMHGYKPSPENLELLTKMLDAGMPLTKANIAQANQAFKMTQNIDQALFLLENNIPASTKNAGLLNALAEGQGKINVQIGNVLDSLAQLPDSAIKDTLVKLFQQIPESLAQAKQAPVPVPVPIPVQAQAEPAPQAPTQQAVQAQTQTQVQTQAQVQVQAPPTQAPQTPQAPIAQAPTAQAVPTPPQQAAPAPAPVIQALQTPVAQAPSAQVPQAQTPATTPAPVPVSVSVPEAPAPPATPLPATPVQTQVQAQTQAPAPAPVPVPADLASLRESLALPLQESSVRDVQSFVNNLREVIAQAQQAIADSPAANDPGTSRVMQSLQNLADNLDFAAQIRNQIFVQIPLLINDQTFNTAMYVNKDGSNKNKNKKEGSGSALIALDTAFLGHFETYVQKEGASVHCQFRLENADIENLVRANIHKLGNQLKEHRYNLDSFTFLLGNKPFSLLDALEEEETQKRLDTVFDASV